MRKRCPIDVSDERLIVIVDGVRTLVDTGSPTSAGARVDLPGGLDAQPPPLERPSAGVDAVLGCDVLARYAVLVDRPNGFILFSTVPLVLGEGSERLDLAAGVPVADVTIAGREVRALLATGCRLGYMDPALASEFAPLGEEGEEHPHLGTFTTPVRRLATVLGDLSLEARFGLLPSPLRQRLLPPGIEWVLGGEVLSDGPVLLELGSGALSFPAD